jgi:hypothetical protein
MEAPVVNYSCENWTINWSDKRKFESDEIKFLRSVAGFTLIDLKRNREIRNHLNIYCVNEKIEKKDNLL